MLRRLAARCAAANLARDAGDTLLELMMTVAIIAIAGTALMGAVLTSITGSSEHRGVVDANSGLITYAETTQNAIMRQAASSGLSCSYPTQTYTEDNGTVVSVAALSYYHWTGSGFAAGCHTSDALQLVTIQATATAAVSNTLTFAVRNPTDASGT